MAAVEAERRPAGWVPWAALSLFFVLAFFYWLVRDAGPKEQARLYRPDAQELLVVPYDDRLWVPREEAVTRVPDSEMVEVGERVGVTVFARPADSLGGGGGLANVAEPPGVAGRYYLKVRDDTYVPLEPQNQWAPE